ncbi:hypothetical protein [Algibacter mikhailovii]|uniref:hypothetical protein n=1 Tax=Algibacter mikhailovii TaxID=425498 RepID=UPI002493F486|nr:hypothetical protein [Algibacter mikhailovii]
MNKISRTANKGFYYILGISLLLGIGIFGFGIFKNLYLLVVYSFLYLIIPLLTISLLVVLISNFRKFGFLSGIKESSINIFALILCSALIWFLQSYAFEKSNRINVEIINKTELGISNITLIGRNALTKIDTLAPKENKTMIFKGKRINYKTENDHENEIRLLYFFDNKWRENKILSGFSRWRVIDKDWEIKIQSADSIELKQK